MTTLLFFDHLLPPLGYHSTQVDISPSVLTALLQSSITLGMVLSPLLMTRINRRIQFSVGCIAIAINMLFLGLDNYSGLSATTPALRCLARAGRK